MGQIAQQIQLRSRPVGLVTEEDIELVEVILPDLVVGEVLVENIAFSVDPYHREAMDSGWELHSPWEGRSVGRVVDSHDTAYAPGDLVFHRQAYTTHAIVTSPRKLPEIPEVSLDAWLGILGGTGLTAWVGLTKIGRLVAGESVLITSAAGAVGLAAGYIARELGAATIIGLTGGDAKITQLVEGPFDMALNYRDPKTAEILSAQLIDLALEGVGGISLETTIDAMVHGGRIAWVGAISQYLDASHPPAAPRNLYQVVEKELRLEGYLVASYREERESYEEFMIPLIIDGKVPVDSTVTWGLDSVVEALHSVFSGGNFGKQIVHLQ